MITIVTWDYQRALSDASTYHSRDLRESRQRYLHAYNHMICKETHACQPYNSRERLSTLATAPPTLMIVRTLEWFVQKRINWGNSFILSISITRKIVKKVKTKIWSLMMVQYTAFEGISTPHWTTRFTGVCSRIVLSEKEMDFKIWENNKFGQWWWSCQTIKNWTLKSAM